VALETVLREKWKHFLLKVCHLRGRELRLGFLVIRTRAESVRTGNDHCQNR
jgi:hypothetical protein